MITIIHCGEDDLAGTTAVRLIDRFVSEAEEAPDWLREIWDPAGVEHARSYVDLKGVPGRTGPAGIKALASELKISVHPRVAGLAAVAYKCVRLAAAHTADVVDGDKALLLSFDSDGHSEETCCRRGVKDAMGKSPRLPVIIAEANPEFDAWIIAGFSPSATHEIDAYQQVGQSLGFDPVVNPERLTSTVREGVRDAKRICQQLLGLNGQAASDDPRVQQCILDTPLATLESNGSAAGIEVFFNDLRTVLLPALGAPPVQPNETE